MTQKLHKTINNTPHTVCTNIYKLLQKLTLLQVSAAIYQNKTEQLLTIKALVLQSHNIVVHSLQRLEFSSRSESTIKFRIFVYKVGYRSPF